MNTFDELRKEISQYYSEWENKLNKILNFLSGRLSQGDFNFVSNEFMFLNKDFGNQQKVIDKQQKKAMLDITTGLYSKTFYDEELNQLSDHYNLAFLIADVDYFKKYNDAYGHIQGDKALWCIAQQFKKSLENLILDYENIGVIRFGGEEICAFIENWQRGDDKLYRIADSVRQDVEFMEIEKAEGEKPLNEGYKHSTITIARGIRNYFEDVHSFVQRVDKELTRKNSDGRNRVYP